MADINIQNSIIKNRLFSKFIKDYVSYIISLLKKILVKNPDLKLNLILTNNPNTISRCNLNKTNNNINIVISINYEHTLVKPGGRNTLNAVSGNIKILDSDTSANPKTYLVRIHNYHHIKNADIIIDYSQPNIYNIEQSNQYSNITSKLIYIAPYLYPYNKLESVKKLDNKSKKNQVLTTFYNITEPRRKALMTLLKTHKLEHQNINNCFSKNNLQKLYKSTKILINIHQTEHHHTFEELRVLPALLNGVIIISEDSPLKERIPYNQYIIWCNYGDIITTTKKVINNYETYYDMIFKNSSFNLEMLPTINYHNLENKLLEIYNNRLFIIKATYGDPDDPTKRIEVVNQVSRLIKDNHLKFIVANKYFEDPCKGIIKTLVINYRLNREACEIMIKEGELVDI